MARIPDPEIDRIKSETDLVALILSRGVALRQQGANWTGFCPFHDDRETANLIVTPGKGLWRCMAAGCGASGNAIQFVEKFDGVSFRHAFEVLSGGNAFAAGDGTPKKIATIPRLSCPLDESVDDSTLLEQVAGYYAQSLSKPLNQAARGYLASRGLDDPELWQRFKIGFADRTLGLGIPHKNRNQGAQIREHLQAAGVYRENGREHLRGCLVIPIRNARGHIVQLYGRRIDPKTPKENRHLYLARPLAGIFNPAALTSREIILTESILDALTFIRHGMDAATCTFGTKNFTAGLFDAIRAAKIESVRLAFDADQAGEIATAEAAARLEAIGIECFALKFPWGMDANQYALDQGGEALRQAVRCAEWLGGQSHQKSVVTAASSKDTLAPVPTNTIVASSLAAKSSAAKEGNGPELAPSFVLTKVGDCHEAAFGLRLYRIGGLVKNNGLESLKITLRLTCAGLMHVDSLDLYRDGERRKFIERAAEETLLDKDLLKRIAAAYDEAGIVGEETNLLAAYLACASRKLKKPLAVIIQSTSAAGKSTLMDAVLSFFPGEEQVKYSAMTGQSLYYLGEGNLKHKILAIVEEEGAEKAGYALKLLQSEGELTIASTGKDPHSGRMETQQYHVEGPVAILFTTTAIDIDEELMNRCLVLTVDESREQTERIHHLQREARTIEGILAAERRRDILHVMQNAQRLIRPMLIANPFARHLTFTSGRTRTRRDHEKYLTLIDTIALLHQYQREPITHLVKSEAGLASREVAMLPVTLDDIETANRIAPEVLGRGLDELSPQTRHLLEHIKALVRKTIKTAAVEQKLALFSRRELRDFTSWSQTQVRRHLERLEELELVTARGGRSGVAIRYELLTDAAQAADTYHVGLIDVAKLRRKQVAPPAEK